MRAKYPGKCADCGEPFAAGTEIVWNPQTKKAVHLSCPEWTRELSKKVDWCMTLDELPYKPGMLVDKGPCCAMMVVYVDISPAHDGGMGFDLVVYCRPATDDEYYAGEGTVTEEDLMRVPCRDLAGDLRAQVRERGVLVDPHEIEGIEFCKRVLGEGIQSVFTLDIDTVYLSEGGRHWRLVDGLIASDIRGVERAGKSIA